MDAMTQRTWRQAARRMADALRADARNGRMLADPWSRAAHSMVQGWRIRLSLPPARSKRPERWRPTWEVFATLAVDIEVSAAGGAHGLAALGSVAGDPNAAICSQAQQDVAGNPGIAGTPISVGGVLDLLRRQQYRCALSGRELTPKTCALDHILPIRHGGEHVIENAQVLDKEVNRAKGSLTSAEFIALCNAVVRWTGHQL